MRINKGFRRFLLISFSFLIVGTAIGVLPVSMAARRYKVTSVKIDKNNFPGKYFRDYVKSDLDGDGDGILSVKEIEKVTALSFSGDFKGESMQGIEYFTELESLVIDKEHWKEDSDQASSVRIPDLDLSANTKLKKLILTSCKLTAQYASTVTYSVSAPGTVQP